MAKYGKMDQTPIPQTVNPKLGEMAGDGAEFQLKGGGKSVAGVPVDGSAVKAMTKPSDLNMTMTKAKSFC